MCSTPDLVNDKNCTPSLWGYVEFQTQDGAPVSPDLLDLDIIKYTIRITRDTVTSTLSTAPLWWTSGSKNGGSRMKYFSGGFIYIQNMIDNGIILTKSNLETGWNFSSLKQR
ncbi:Oidioi.mRNA.OKI2018_I69.chr1.g3723.t1.cds [Oikopleura dioica]|uniref:Oidioi.mRNA.OKI2018_I69.chr1.g3723.t1.cds n=1 Tax=Oikopleura dioica TaxID=34765 RepID=A0ABN7SZC2_OIKDI|nr:Oidioi.mRNA.OKI2018_I69.chr1.g3723.t1.cds [Oikopleura dioica]